jgi:hypothetical protein
MRPPLRSCSSASPPRLAGSDRVSALVRGTMKCFLQRRAVFDHPTVHGGMIHRNTALAHELFDMARAQRLRDIPANTRQNDFLWEMGSLEAHSHQSSPSLITLDNGGRSYLKWPQMKIATEPTQTLVSDHWLFLQHYRTVSQSSCDSVALAAILTATTTARILR